MLDEYRRYGWFRDLDDLQSRSQLWLLTKDIVLDYAKPMMPNMVHVGGLTVGKTGGKLPKEMKRFIHLFAQYNQENTLGHFIFG